MLRKEKVEGEPRSGAYIKISNEDCCFLSDAFIMLQGNPGKQTDSENQSCSMTGLPGIIIQISLGVLSFSVLIIKRFRQSPQRPWRIWIFDTSKQLISQLMAHFINLTISIALTYNDASSDECLWYLMTNILDNTLGVVVCVGLLRGVEWWLQRKGKKEFISGNYYRKQKVILRVEVGDHKEVQIGIDHSDEPVRKGEMQEERQSDGVVAENEYHEYKEEGISIEPSPSHNTEANRPSAFQREQTQCLEKYHVNYKFWMVQLFIWVVIVVIGKSLLFAFEYALKNPLKSLSFTLMGWIEQYPVLELLVVIVVVPVGMNGLAFWVQDNFLMKRQQQKPEEGHNPLVEQLNAQKNMKKEQQMAVLEL